MTEPSSTTMVCKKCGAEQPEASACRKCGLLRARMASYRDDQADVLDGPWSELEARWDEEAAHEAFLGVVVDRRAFADAARRYRARLGDDAGRAQAMLERIPRMAESVMLAGRKPVADLGAGASSRRRWLIFGAVLLMVIVIATQLARRRAASHEARPPILQPTR